MVDWNPSYPEVLGLEWWPNQRQTTRVFASSPPRLNRITSTVTETIESLKMSATVDPLLKADTFTIMDVFEEGEEVNLPDFTPIELIPNGDVTVSTWRTQSGSSTNLYQSIDENATRWPGPAQNTWIQTTSAPQDYKCTVDASAFGAGGAYENARIGWVELYAILGANTGYRKLKATIEIAGTQYPPAGGNLRNVHGFGALYKFWYGELNPATERPWLPADIANFGTSGNSTLYLRSQEAIASHFPKVYAFRLVVHCVPNENRAAVGVYRRPETLTVGQVKPVTDALLTLPAGTANWAKETGKNYTFLWRQSVCPALYGPVNADDIRWNGAFQHLGPRGVPANFAYPLTSIESPAPATGFASTTTNCDYNGRPIPPSGALPMTSQAAYGLVLQKAGGVASVDGQPYRTDLDALVSLKNGSPSAAQRFTLPTTQSYLAVKFPIVPPASGDGNLVVAVHDVSTGALVGGTFVITASAVRRLTPGRNGWRYVSGLLASAATLNSGVQYEVRFSTGTPQPWFLLAPDCSLGNTISIGGTTDTYASAGVANINRDLCVNLIKQPDAPVSPTATTTTVNVAMPDLSTRAVEHVTVAWGTPPVGLGTSFLRYEVERRTADDEWTRIANVNNAAVLSFVDHLAKRQVEAFYRVRVMGKDGRFSIWSETTGVTPPDGDYDVLLTSNHYPDLEVVLDQSTESSFTFRNNESNEVIQLHGADYQVVFTEEEDRGVSWSFTADVNFGDAPPPGRGGARAFDALRAITDSKGVIPYVGVLDFYGARVLAHVTLTNATQSSPGNVYKVTLEVTPTYVEEVPAEVTE